MSSVALNSRILGVQVRSHMIFSAHNNIIKSLGTCATSWSLTLIAEYKKINPFSCHEEDDDRGASCQFLPMKTWINSGKIQALLLIEFNRLSNDYFRSVFQLLVRFRPKT